MFFYLCSGIMVSADVDEVELEDGTKVQPVSVIFPEDNNIPAQNQDQVQPCTQTSLHYYEKVMAKKGCCFCHLPQCRVLCHVV